jgi:hypothetical protein
MSIEVEITADTISPKLGNFLANLSESLEEYLGTMETPLIQTAREYVRVRTGALRDSIYATTLGNQITFGAMRAYAAINEYGGVTRNYPAQPFMRPSVDENFQGLLQAVLDGAIAALTG